MYCVGCDILLNDKGLDGICEACYSDSTVFNDEGYVLYLQDSYPDESQSLSAEQWDRYNEEYRRALDEMIAHRRRAESDAFRMRALGMSLRQFCAYKIRHSLDGGKVYLLEDSYRFAD